jgi:hypothetical protein
MEGVTQQYQTRQVKALRGKMRGHPSTHGFPASK